MLSIRFSTRWNAIRALKSRRKTVNSRSRIYYSVTPAGSHRLADLSDAWTNLAAAIRKMLKGERHAQPFHELRERLLRAGVAPRHVRRCLTELSDHFADLTAEEQRAGRTPADAQSAALIRLGRIDDLANAMINQRKFQSWCTRAPWAMFAIAPLFLLAGAYLVACIILWSGWKIFLPGSDTPFVGPIYGMAIFYFGVGRWLYFGAPVLVGWGIGLIAARQRFNPLWPTIGLILISLLGAPLRSTPAAHPSPAESNMSAWISPSGLPFRRFPTPFFVPW